MSEDLTIQKYCQNGNIKMVKQKIESGYPVKNDPDRILHIAVSRNNYSMTEFLIENGANVNIKNDKGDNLLHVIVKALPFSIDYDMLDLLIDNVININERDNRGATPLYIVSSSHYCSEEHIKLINYLLDRGADPFIFDNVRYSCPIFEISRRDLINILKRINLDENNINMKNNMGRTLLHVACRGAAWNTAKYLIEKGIDKSIRDEDNHDARDQACSYFYEYFDDDDEDDNSMDIIDELFPPSGDKTKSANYNIGF